MNNTKSIIQNIYVEPYGTIKVVDQLNYLNNGSETVTSIYISVDDEYLPNLNFISAKDNIGSSLNYQKMNIKIDGHQIYSVYLNQPLLPGTTENHMTCLHVTVFSLTMNPRDVD